MSYCSTPKACGYNQPSEEGNFDLSYLTEEALKIFDWKQQVLETMANWGNYACCIVLLYLLIRISYLIKCTISTRRKGITLNVMILDEFRNTLIRSEIDPQNHLLMKWRHLVNLHFVILHFVNFTFGQPYIWSITTFGQLIHFIPLHLVN